MIQEEIKNDEIQSNRSKIEIETLHIDENTKDSFTSPFKFSIRKEKSYIFPQQNEEFWKKIQDDITFMSNGSKSFRSVLKIIEKIITENLKYKFPKYNVNILDKFFSAMSPLQRDHAESKVFPFIAKLINETDEIFPYGLSFLNQDLAYELKLSKKQCACLLSHMFMCTNLNQGSTKYSRDFNFSYFYNEEKNKNANKNFKSEIIKCIWNYFLRIAEEIPDRFVIFKRLVLDDKSIPCSINNWTNSRDQILGVEVSETGSIEDEVGSIEVDFANRYLGGKSLAGGNAQEEIIFADSPECYVGMLFCEYMKDNEALLIQGAEKYNEHNGYRKSFSFKKNCNMKRETNMEKVLNREILALDAINFKHCQVPQFSEEAILRELNKALVGFSGGDDLGFPKKKISTGNWGCGVFKGDVQLKFVIQILAAARAKRRLKYFTFGHPELSIAGDIIKKLEGFDVGEITKRLLKYCEERNLKKSLNLFEYILVNFE